MERGDEVSTPNGSDPIDRLHAADPARADGVPDASLARVTASVQEHIMSGNEFDPTVRPSRGPLALVGGLALAGAFALTRVLRNHLYETGTTDATTFVSVSLLLVHVALLACLIPARRATKVDPMVALRHD